jgi:hypothetical protein
VEVELMSTLDEINKRFGELIEQGPAGPSAGWLEILNPLPQHPRTLRVSDRSGDHRVEKQHGRVADYSVPHP